MTTDLRNADSIGRGLKLDLGCGVHCAPGFEGVDIAPCHPDVKHVLNLLDFPWPFADGSVDELRCIHFIEHIPQGYWTPRRSQSTGTSGLQRSEGAATKDTKGVLSVFPHDHRSLCLFMKFFDEAYRVLKPGGGILVECPQVHNHRAWQDPDHKQFLVGERFFYLSANWRKQMGLEHGAYGVSCDFSFVIDHTFPVLAGKEVELLMRTQQGRKILQERDRSRWGVTEDLRVTLVKETATAVTRTSSPEAEATELDRQIAEANARLGMEEPDPSSVLPSAKAVDRDSSEVADGEELCLFRVTSLPGGFQVDPGTMFLPGMSAPVQSVVVRFDDPTPGELAGGAS